MKLKAIIIALILTVASIEASDAGPIVSCPKPAVGEMVPTTWDQFLELTREYRAQNPKQFNAKAYRYRLEEEGSVIPLDRLFIEMAMNIDALKALASKYDDAHCFPMVDAITKHIDELQRFVNIFNPGSSSPAK